MAYVYWFHSKMSRIKIKFHQIQIIIEFFTLNIHSEKYDVSGNGLSS